MKVQEEKYENRLLPHSNFYHWDLMVQQFLQAKLKTQSSQSRWGLALTVAQSFGRGLSTRQNIVWWEKSWVSLREIPEKKEKDDGDLWIYDEDINDVIRNFARAQGNSKYI